VVWMCGWRGVWVAWGLGRGVWGGKWGGWGVFRGGGGCRGIPCELRSNIPRSALCATLDT
jgi:hypothetical protein